MLGPGPVFPSTLLRRETRTRGTPEEPDRRPPRGGQGLLHWATTLRIFRGGVRPRRHGSRPLVLNLNLRSRRQITDSLDLKDQKFCLHMVRGGMSPITLTSRSTRHSPSRMCDLNSGNRWPDECRCRSFPDFRVERICPDGGDPDTVSGGLPPLLPPLSRFGRDVSRTEETPRGSVTRPHAHRTTHRGETFRVE